MKISKVNQNTTKLIQEEQTWEKTVKKNGKSDSIEILASLVGKQLAQPHHTELERTIKQGKKLLQKHVHKPKHTNALKAVSIAEKEIKNVIDKKPPTITYPTLHTAKTTNKKALKELEKVSFDWHSKGVVKQIIAQSISLPNEKLQLIDDSLNTTDALAADASSINKKKDAVYCAYDSSHKIHAIATVHIYKDGDRKVHVLSSNPDSLPIFGTEDQVKGAGSSLMRHIAYDTLNDKKHLKNPGTVKLMALDTAIPFYEKLGMKIYNNKEDKMNFTLEKMKEFVAGKPDTHIMSDTFPKAKFK